MFTVNVGKYTWILWVRLTWTSQNQAIIYSFAKDSIFISIEDGFCLSQFAKPLTRSLTTCSFGLEFSRLWRAHLFTMRPRKTWMIRPFKFWWVWRSPCSTKGKGKGGFGQASGLDACVQREGAGTQSCFGDVLKHSKGLRSGNCELSRPDPKRPFCPSDALAAWRCQTDGAEWQLETTNPSSQKIITAMLENKKPTWFTWKWGDPTGKGDEPILYIEITPHFRSFELFKKIQGV